MASKSLFTSSSNSVSSAITTNAAGGKAYSMSDKAALTQIVMTGCFQNTYYISDKDQLAAVLKLAQNVDPKYIAKLAVYARKNGFMKDSPALLAAIVSSKAPELLPKIFSRVIDDPKMLRNFVQIVRSGVTGRKSLGTAPKRLIKNYLDAMTDDQLFKANVGNDPSLQDIIKLTHPRPQTPARAALYSYLLDKEYKFSDLPALVKNFENFKKGETLEIPDVPFQMLTALPLSDANWKEIAKNATWTQTRMNLNTFARHGVFNDSEMVDLIANRLNSKEQVERTKVFPYQLFSAFLNVDDTVPAKVKNAVQHAADYALQNIPAMPGKVYIAVDTSGSMGSPVTGYAGRGPSSKMTCVQAAALMASAILKKNPDAEIIPFDVQTHKHSLNALDSIMTNAAALARFGGGGTDCSAPLRELNSRSARGDMVLYLSDNESWVQSSATGRYDSYYGRRAVTSMKEEWDKFKNRNKGAKLVCLDITPNTTTQAPDDKDTLNLGGFSDAMFEVVARFALTANDENLFSARIEEVEL